MGSISKKEKEMKKKFRDFEDAREFVRALNLKGQKEWIEYSKSNKRPDDIPVHPERVYKKECKGMGDWLGTGNISNIAKSKNHLSFEDAQKFVQSLNLKNQQEWKEYSKSGKRPDDIPSSPNRVYKNKGWKGYGYWLGTGRIADQEKVFRSFEEARKFVQSLNLKNQQEWKEYSKSGKRPDDIPSPPNRVYKKEWVSWGNWLGTGRIADQEKVFRSFEEARKFVQSLNLKGQKEWREYSKSNNRPDDIPSAPEQVYKNKGWSGMGDWLGTRSIATKDIQYRSLEDAKKFVRKLKLKNQKEWLDYCASGDKPDDIPANPWRTYKTWEKR
jgi:hypothetical protein